MSDTATTITAPPTAAGPATSTGGRPSPGLLVLLLLSALLTVLAVPVLAVGGVAAVVAGGGVLETPTAPFSSTGYALTSTSASIDGQDGVLERVELLLRASPADGSGPVFVGIGPSDDVARYLSGVPHSVVEQIATVPAFAVRLRPTEGSRAPEPPAEQSFWIASAVSGRTAELRAPLASGDWTVVVMNADASAPVDVRLSAGVRSDLLGPGAVVLVILGAIALLLGITGIVVGALVSGGSLALQTDGEAAAVSPAVVTGELDPAVSRGLWLVKWFLAIPHVLVLALLWVALTVTTAISWFAILFVGRYPRPFFAFAVGVLRWSWRVSFYAFGPIGTDRYPAFTLARTDYPADLDVSYPERLSRGLIFVKSWLLALPQLIVVGLVTTAPNGTDDGPGLAVSLITALTLVAGVLLLVRGRYPRPLFDLLVGLQRWGYRVAAYVLLLRDDYPPFRLDQGPREPRPESVPS